MKKDKTICVIGSGVSGLSCAYELLKRGWKVTIISKHNPRKNSEDPQFSSLYPAASIIPHSIFSGNLKPVFKQSQQYFRHLYKQQFPGVNLYEHFELFASQRSQPDYANLMDGFALLNDFSETFYPKHPQIKIKSGWKFICFFADWNLYFPALLNQVLQYGAKLEIKTLERKDIPALPYDCIINCSEMGAIQLFGDEHRLLYRGHILHVLEAQKVMSPDGTPVSYNFTPGKNIYKSDNKNPQDVYFYPRSDGWILGGSRQKGFLDSSGNWQGENNIDPKEIIDGIEVPAQILKLHSEIIQNTFGINLYDFPKIKAKMGYRYVRKKKEGLRLETEEIGDKLIVHNYGHGGAGVTLSWGCALKTVQLLKENIN